jgi:hypothetical protein
MDRKQRGSRYQPGEPDGKWLFRDVHVFPGAWSVRHNDEVHRSGGIQRGRVACREGAVVVNGVAHQHNRDPWGRASVFRLRRDYTLDVMAKVG